MEREHLSLGRLSPSLVTHGIQKPKFSASSLNHFSSHNHTDLFPLRIEQNQPNPPLTRLTCSPYALKANPAATYYRPKWYLMVGGLILRTPLNEVATYSSPKSILRTTRGRLTREPEPEMTPTQSTQEPFGKKLLHFLTILNFSSACPATPSLVIVIDNTPVRSPLPSPDSAAFPPPLPQISLSLPPGTQPPPSPRCQAPLIPPMMLSSNSPTCNQQ
ncbi:hypothetical protein O181_052076 [Austropuccinia psidii MF-1]|uniref:Uncharacterized protein n=1 Tax=Austropuccinia psidii MF-1 TaxID=1389203 RepID=A0A9Q3E4X3_9BASI|nr:hypothetical protein [Austropuccinia psidii MF-1]